MATEAVEERLTMVEHKVAENAHGMDGLRDALVAGFKAVDRRFEAVDRRFEAIDRRFEAVDRRFDAIDRRFQAMDLRLDAINQTMDRRFLWLTGTLMATMLAVLGIVAAALLGG